MTRKGGGKRLKEKDKGELTGNWRRGKGKDNKV